MGLLHPVVALVDTASPPIPGRPSNPPRSPRFGGFGDVVGSSTIQHASAGVRGGATSCCDTKRPHGPAWPVRHSRPGSPWREECPSVCFCVVNGWRLRTCSWFWVSGVRPFLIEGKPLFHLVWGLSSQAAEELSSFQTQIHPHAGATGY